MTGKSEIPERAAAFDRSRSRAESAGREKLGVALAKLPAEDPSFRVSSDPTCHWRPA